MKIIGISGKKGSGKNTVANMIESLCVTPDFHVVQLGFADALKDEICSEFQVTRSFIEENKDMFRTLLQSWGELKRRIFGEDYWVNKTLKKLSQLPPEVKLAIIYDLRYKNEAEILKKTNGTILIRLDRFIPFLAQDKHISEVDLDDFHRWDEVIDNRGSLNDLIEKVSKIINTRKLCQMK